MSRPASTGPGRIASIDLLNLLAILAVTVMHSTYIMTMVTPFESWEWWSASLTNCLSRFCVPVFLMCSGAMLMDAKRMASAPGFYKKRLPKLIVPLLAWSVIYYYSERQWSEDFDYDLWTLLGRIVDGKVMQHLWYSYMLIQVYLAAPFLFALFGKQDDPRPCWWFIVICFICNGINPYLLAFFGCQFNFEYAVFTIYVGYFLLGYALSNVVLGAKGRLWCVAAFLLGGAVTVWGNHYCQANKMNDPFLFLRYESLNVLAMSVAAHLFVRSFRMQNIPAWLGRTLAQISGCTYGVYLAHMLFRDWFFLRGWSALTMSKETGWPLLSILAGSALVYASSLALVLILRRIPLARRIVS